MNRERIVLAHGDGGALTRELVGSVFVSHFENETLGRLSDAAYLPSEGQRIAVTTDSYVITPLFFPGGDIGKLSICGTVNDLAVSGAVPICLTASFLIEEGFSIDMLERIVSSMAETAAEANVDVVAGDTKVVEKGQLDGLFINTTGIGTVHCDPEPGCHRIEPGDRVIVNGPVGNHGLTVITQRQKLELGGPLESDCASLAGLLADVFCGINGVKMARDLTRGGLASVLAEIAEDAGLDISLGEESIPVEGVVEAGCDMLGLDPLYLANEGKFVLVVDPKEAGEALQLLRSHPLGRGAAEIGTVKDSGGDLLLTTPLGGTRRLDLLAGDPLPRIC